MKHKIIGLLAAAAAVSAVYSPSADASTAAHQPGAIVQAITHGHEAICEAHGTAGEPTTSRLKCIASKSAEAEEAIGTSGFCASAKDIYSLYRQRVRGLSQEVLRLYVGKCNPAAHASHVLDLTEHCASLGYSTRGVWMCRRNRLMDLDSPVAATDRLKYCLNREPLHQRYNSGERGTIPIALLRGYLANGCDEFLYKIRRAASVPLPDPLSASAVPLPSAVDPPEPVLAARSGLPLRHDDTPQTTHCDLDCRAAGVSEAAGTPAYCQARESIFTMYARGERGLPVATVREYVRHCR